MSEQEKPGTGHNHPKRGGEEVRYVPVEYMDQGYRDEDEISLIDLIKVLWDGRKKIIICTGLFFLLGLFIFLFSERQFESEAILIHEDQQQESQAQRLLQQFGGFGGGGAQQAPGVIPSSLYPRIMESADFMLAVVTHEVEFKEPEASMTALTYFNEYYEPPMTERTADFLVDYTIKLPITVYRGVRGLFSSRPEFEELPEEILRDERFLDLTREERRAISFMRDRMELEQDGNLNTFKVQMPDARAAAELNEFIIDQIQEYVIDYRIQKYRENLEFVERQKEQARERYEEAQLELARFNDRNVNITTSVARTQQEDLQNRRNITYNVYNNLAQELEQSRIRLQEETPVFNVLQRPNLPHEIGGVTPLLLVLPIFLGAFFGIFLVLSSRVWRTVRDTIVT